MGTLCVLQQVVRKNLRVRLGDVISVHQVREPYIHDLHDLKMGMPWAFVGCVSAVYLHCQRCVRPFFMVHHGPCMKQHVATATPACLWC